MTDILVIIGGTALLSISFAALLLLMFVGKNSILKIKHRYAYQHRFDKKPTAKCYCRDCKMWNPESWECYDPYNSRVMNETAFCSFAQPQDIAHTKLDDNR